MFFFYNWNTLHKTAKRSVRKTSDIQNSSPRQGEEGLHQIQPLPFKGDMPRSCNAN